MPTQYRSYVLTFCFLLSLPCIGIAQGHARKFSGLEGKVIYSMIQIKNGSLVIAADSMMYISTNQGSTWDRAGSMPDTNSTLAADTMGTIYSLNGKNGTFYSSNMGNSWNTILSTTVNRISVSSNGTIYRDGIYSSSDKGASWIFHQMTDHALAVDNNGNAYVGTGFALYSRVTGFTVYSGGVSVSRDNGNSWTKLAGSSGSICDFVSAGPDAKIIFSDYYYTNSNYSPPIVHNTYLYDDNTKITTNLGQIQSLGYQRLLMDAHNNIFSQNSTNIYSSQDGGISWQTESNGLSESNFTSLFIDKENYVYAGTRNGIYRIVQPISPVDPSNIPDTPNLLAPSVGIIIQPDTVRFSWASSSKAIGYKFQLWPNNGFPNDVIISDTSIVVFNLKHYYDYYWRVKAWNYLGQSAWSQNYMFQTSLSPEMIYMGMPPQHMVVQQDSILFKWNTGIWNLLYDFQLSHDSLFSPSGIIIDTVMLQSSYVIPSPLSPGLYYWRVGIQSNSTISCWSYVHSFLIPILPESISLTWPPKDTTVQQDSIQFSWNGVPSSHFNFQLSTDSVFSPSGIIKDTILDGNSYKINTLTERRKYYWRLGVINNNIITGWTTINSFTTRAAKVIERIPYTGRLSNDLFPNYPNPFNSQTKIRFSIETAQKVSVSIYTISGSLIAKLCDEQLAEGVYEVRWNADVATSGVLFCRISTNIFSKTIKLLFLK
ncbi:MAG: T9SS type A sorting domain-containing protein [Bacteroidota bacterium]